METPNKKVSKSQAKKPVDLSGENEEPKFFDVPKAIKEELESKGYVCRWISVIKYQANYSWHKSGWKAYKTTPSAIKPGSLDFGDGVDAEGFIRRGDMVLAVKTRAMADAYKAKVDRKNAALNRFTKTAAEDLKQTLGSKGSVIEGYDENGGDE